MMKKTHPNLPIFYLESPSLLAACEPGPVLLICPTFDSGQSHCSTATWSCDAWFLWRPEAISSRVFAHSQSLQIALEETDGRYMLKNKPGCISSSRYINMVFLMTQIQVCAESYPQLTSPLLTRSALFS